MASSNSGNGRYSRIPIQTLLSGPPQPPMESESSAMHNPRPPRPSYSEEQKFYIMFCRIVRDERWEDIEARFGAEFQPRSRGGLTSVYYRIRRDWGLREVLKSGPMFYPGDVEEVRKRAHRVSPEFLVRIGYMATLAK